MIPRDAPNPMPPALDNNLNAVGLIPNLIADAMLGLTPLAAI